MKKNDLNYTFLDKTLHYVAFSTGWLPRVLSELETDIHKIESDGLTVPHPVYVTGLPRAGTTLILNLLYDTEEFVSFTYRDMPFINCPNLWARINGISKRDHELQERAHDDGLKIGYDSPEAFDEVLWLTLLKKDYVKEEFIKLVSPDMLPDQFDQQYMAAINRLIHARKSQVGDRRYLAKNNSLISRLDTLIQVLPDSKIVLCIRDPDTHAQSLLNQHRRFFELHQSDKFSRKYMEWIGHYDFGVNFKPIEFGHTNDLDKMTLDYWYKYWVDVYKALMTYDYPNMALVAHETLVTDPGSTLEKLAEFVALEVPERLISQASSINSKPKPGIKHNDRNSVQAEASEIYQNLLRRCI